MTIDPIDSTIKAYDSNASSYSEFRPLIQPVKNRMDYFADLVKGLSGVRVLDVGCGPGRDSEYLSSLGLEVTGIDMSNSLLEKARETVKGVNFLHMDMRKIKFENETFSGLWVNTSFLHIPKEFAKSTLEEFNRVLDKHGILFLGIQGHKNDKGEVTGQLSDTELMIKNPDFNNDSRLFVIYEQGEITNLLLNSGFEEITIDTREEEETKIKWLNIFAKKKV